jgi:hypothetical protein
VFPDPHVLDKACESLHDTVTWEVMRW